MRSALIMPDTALLKGMGLSGTGSGIATVAERHAILVVTITLTDALFDGYGSVFGTLRLLQRLPVRWLIRFLPFYRVSASRVNPIPMFMTCTYYI